MKNLWILLISVFIFSFCILGWVGTDREDRVAKQPHPTQVLHIGAVAFVWFALGLMLRKQKPLVASTETT